MIQVNRIYLIFNRLVTKKFLVDTSDCCALINKALARKKRNIFVLDIIVNFNLNINTILDRINLSQIIL